MAQQEMEQLDPLQFFQQLQVQVEQILMHHQVDHLELLEDQVVVHKVHQEVIYQAEQVIHHQ